MRNAIKYYYAIDVETLKQENDDFYFDNYVLKKVKKDFDINLYNFFISNNMYVHNIVYNSMGEYITNIDNKNYILIEKKYNVDVDMMEVVKFLVDVNPMVKKDWGKLWENKVDYYEKNIVNLKNKEYLDVFPYYIGLSELAIRMYHELEGEGTYSICHDRLGNSTDFFSPDNIIIDYKVRDIAEYIKKSFFSNHLNMDEVIDGIEQAGLKQVDYQLLYARLLFPTYYFDCLESDDQLSKYVSRINQYELFLRDIYLYLQVYAPIPKIDWILKKV